MAAAANSTVVVNVYANVVFEVNIPTADQTWLESATEGGKVTFTAKTKNEGTEDRSATVTIKEKLEGEGIPISKTVTISQAKQEAPAKTLSATLASDEALAAAAGSKVTLNVTAVGVAAYSVTPAETWLTATDKGEGKWELEATTANTAVEERTCVVTIAETGEGASLTKEVTVKQAGTPAPAKKFDFVTAGNATQEVTSAAGTFTVLFDSDYATDKVTIVVKDETGADVTWLRATAEAAMDANVKTVVTFAYDANEEAGATARIAKVSVMAVDGENNATKVVTVTQKIQETARR